MIAEDGDTIASAAVFVQLEPSESSKWLKDKDGNWVGQDTPIEKGCHYTVPNIVYVTSGNMTTKKNRKMNWKSGFPLLLNAAVKSRTEEYVRDMQARGYMVVEKQDVSRADVSEFVRDQDIQGWFFIGHGDKGNGRLIVEPDERWMRPDALVKHQHHKLGFVTLFACYAGRNVDDAKGGEGAGWGQLVSSNGTLRTASWNVKPYWPFVDHWTQIPIVAE